MNFSVWIATISLVISLILSFLEINRRLRKPHFSITGVDVISGRGNEIFVVLYLTFLNNSTIPITIYRLDLNFWRTTRFPKCLDYQTPNYR